MHSSLSQVGLKKGCFGAASFSELLDPGLEFLDLDKHMQLKCVRAYQLSWLTAFVDGHSVMGKA